MLEPRRLQILEQSLSSAFAPVAALAIPAEPAGSVKKIRAIHPHDSGLELRRNMQGYVDALAPDASRQAVHRVIRELHRFARSSKRHGCQNRSENLLLRHHRRRMHVTQQ